MSAPLLSPPPHPAETAVPLRRTGIFGGSFNPIHNGHIALAQQILHTGMVDEIWFLVSPLNPLKSSAGDLLADDLRLQLARQALEGHTGLAASDYEFHLPRPSYMWNTLCRLARDFPTRAFVLIIGADNWLAFDRWAKPEYILAHHDILVYPRSGFPIDERSLPHNVHLTHTRLYPISSTDIRRRVAARLPIDHLVPPDIRPLVMKYYQ